MKEKARHTTESKKKVDTVFERDNTRRWRQHHRDIFYLAATSLLCLGGTIGLMIDASLDHKRTLNNLSTSESIIETSDAKVDSINTNIAELLTISPTVTPDYVNFGITNTSTVTVTPTPNH